MNMVQLPRAGDSWRMWLVTDSGLLHFKSESAGISDLGPSPHSRVVTRCHNALFVERKSPTHEAIFSHSGR